jgi:hypothetical protein
MFKIGENFEVKKSKLAIGVSVLITTALSIGVYINRKRIMNYFKPDFNTIDADEKIVNNLEDKDDTEADDTEEDKEVADTEVTISTPIFLTRGTTVLDTLVEENEKIRTTQNDE